ncbi:GNAT family N-acetyltransferase [Halovivax gelatinilyticus]|uniref:GNAT family N-acetyltransferase n=1 Tax=Halovivax gelatinilyticus TaxID=2961597 RepID=UPI0020CA35BC|nr:GNAT family N-acetyltransferase [Halovivax gelatinilyticus]
MTIDVRPYRPATDEAALWRMKEAFERELGSKTGGADKRETYEAKLDADYRARYGSWVDRCLADEPDAITVATDGAEPVGYVFVLPETLSMIWDAGVLNEIYVEPSYRGTGVADRLIERAMDVVRSQSLPIDRLVLDVDPDNDRAYEFYRRHGFDSWGEMVAVEL